MAWLAALARCDYCNKQSSVGVLCVCQCVCWSWPWPQALRKQLNWAKCQFGVLTREGTRCSNGEGHFWGDGIVISPQDVLQRFNLQYGVTLNFSPLKNPPAMQPFINIQINS